jgi:tetratricopeptide (TPR) repeat protein
MNRTELLMQMLNESPDDPFLIYAFALEKYKDSKLTEAIEDLKKLSVSNPDYLATYYQLGKFYEEANALSNAIEIYKAGKIIAKEQKNTKTLNELNEALLQLTEDTD